VCAGAGISQGMDRTFGSEGSEFKRGMRSNGWGRGGGGRQVSRSCSSPQQFTKNIKSNRVKQGTNIVMEAKASHLEPESQSWDSYEVQLLQVAKTAA